MYEGLIVICVLLAFTAIMGIAMFFMENPYQMPTEKIKGYPTVQQIRELNAQYAAQRAKKQVEIERGKILAFKRKSWYKSTKVKTNGDQT